MSLRLTWKFSAIFGPVDAKKILSMKTLKFIDLFSNNLFGESNDIIFSNDVLCLITFCDGNNCYGN